MSTPNRNLRVLLVDDHPLIREGMAELVSRLQGFDEADQAANGEEALRLAADRPYDIVVLDVSMPGKSGLSVLKQLKAMEPAPAVVVVSMHGERRYGPQARELGADVYLEKSQAPTQLEQVLLELVEKRLGILDTRPPAAP